MGEGVGLSEGALHLEQGLPGEHGQGRALGQVGATEGLGGVGQLSLYLRPGPEHRVHLVPGRAVLGAEHHPPLLDVAEGGGGEELQALEIEVLAIPEDGDVLEAEVLAAPGHQGIRREHYRLGVQARQGVQAGQVEVVRVAVAHHDHIGAQGLRTQHARRAHSEDTIVVRRSQQRVEEQAQAGGFHQPHGVSEGGPVHAPGVLW